MELKPLRRCLPDPAVEVGAVDQLGLAGGAGPGGDQRGYRDALAALRGHLHHRGAAAAAPGAALGAASDPGRAGTWTFQRSGAAAHPARPACSPSRTARGPGRRSAASSTGPASPRRPGRRPAPPPARATGRGSACAGPRPRPRRPAPASRRLPAPAATGSPTSVTPGTAGPPPGRWCRPRSAQQRPAASASGGPVLRRSARRHRGTSWFRQSALRRPSPEPVPPRLKIFFRW